MTKLSVFFRDAGLVFTAVKRKKLRHFPSFRALKVESVQSLLVRSLYETMHNMSRQTEFHADTAQ